jgi:hypothetical protein
MKQVPYQSYNRRVRYPGASIAARDLGVHRGHLHAVLCGTRESRTLQARWNEWLRLHPEFAALQPRKPARKP